MNASWPAFSATPTTCVSTVARPVSMISAPNSRTGSRPRRCAGEDRRQRRISSHSVSATATTTVRPWISSRTPATRRRVGDHQRVLGVRAHAVARREEHAQRLRHRRDVAERGDAPLGAALEPAGRERQQQVQQQRDRDRVGHRPERPQQVAVEQLQAAQRDADPDQRHQHARAVVGPAQPGVRADPDEAPRQDEPDVRDRGPARRQPPEVRRDHEQSDGDRQDDQARCRDGHTHERAAYRAETGRANRPHHPRRAARRLPAAAQAKSFRGKTSQGRMASVVVGDDGFVTRIRISYSAPCTDPRYRFPNVLRVEPPFDESTTEKVTEELDPARQARRRRPQPADGDDHRRAHRRGGRHRVLERDVQDPRRAHQGRRAARRLRAQARDVDGDRASIAPIVPSAAGARIASPSSARAITSRWISLVPS